MSENYKKGKSAEGCFFLSLPWVNVCMFIISSIHERVLRQIKHTIYLISLFVASERVLLLSSLGEAMPRQDHVESVLPAHGFGARPREETEGGLLKQHGATQVAVL